MTDKEQKIKFIPFIKTDKSITVNFNGETHTLFSTDKNYQLVYDALKERRFDDVPNLISMAKRIENSSGGLFYVKNDRVYVDDQEVPLLLGRKILEFESEGLPFEPLVAFFKNLNQNPSNRAVQELFGCLEKNHHPITEDGCFIAYKKVRDDFKDCHSGTFDNSVGKLVSVARNSVNEDSSVTCSYGLHVASYEYARDFYGGGVLLQVKVNPKDVVAVPKDYNEQKMRVCAYEVLEIMEHKQMDNLVNSRGVPYNNKSDVYDDTEHSELEDSSDESSSVDDESSSSSWED